MFSRFFVFLVKESNVTWVFNFLEKLILFFFLLNLGDSDQERYFFSKVEAKYPNGKRSNRTAESGYWKPTGVDKKILDSRKKQVGTKKTLVFYTSKPPKGFKTNWVMHEFKLANSGAQVRGSKSTLHDVLVIKIQNFENPCWNCVQGMENWVICRVLLKKSSRKDVVKDEEMVEDENQGLVFYDFIGGPRKFDLNLDGGDFGYESSCSSGVTVAGEDEGNSN